MDIRLTVGLEIPPEASGVELQAGLVLPSPMVATTTTEEGHRVEATISFDEARQQFVCSGLSVSQLEDGPPVTGDALRTVKVMRLVRSAVELAQMRVAEPNDGRDVPTLIDVPNAVPPPGIAKQGPTDEVLRWVAQLYTLATMLNLPPTKNVQDKLEVSRATAGRWVAEARRQGLIGES